MVFSNDLRNINELFVYISKVKFVKTEINVAFFTPVNDHHHAFHAGCSFSAQNVECDQYFSKSYWLSQEPLNQD